MRTKKINRTALMTVFAIVAVIIVTYTNNIVSNAAAAVPASYQCVFDANYYASRYPDLQAAFGNNEAALFNHFVTCGMAEGRQGSAEFDVNYYRATYADLQAAFGDNLPAYYAHYMNNGKAEGRTGAGAAPVVNNTSVANTNTQANNGARVYNLDGRRESEKIFYTRILDSILTPGMTDMEVAKAIHDYLCRTYHYAQAGETVTTLNDIYMESIGVYEDGYGMYANQAMANSTAFQCYGYAQGFLTLMNIAGIPTVEVVGLSERGIGHAWNCSYINGQYLYTDVTYDDALNTTKYFMISEAQMNLDHTPRQTHGSF